MKNMKCLFAASLGQKRRKQGGKRVFFLILTVVMVFGLMPVFEIESHAASDLSSLSCASFITNADHAKYIDMMMRYYITHNSSVQSSLDSGKSAIFMFEGGSDNYPGTRYSLSDYRYQAAVIVVKKDSSGGYYIALHDEGCSSIPDDPSQTTGGASNGSTTILDGVYSVTTTNHKGYGALHVNVSKGYYTPPSNKNGLINTCSGINIHTRSSSRPSSSNPWSAGCQLIGYGGTSSNSFNNFMKQVAGINYNVWINYSNKEFNTVTTGVNVGSYIVDRQLAKDGLVSSGLYNKTAIDAITEYSTAAKEAADPILYTVTYDANGGTGAPAAQTKTRGVPLTLSSTVPTRSGYIFLGWIASNTSSLHRYMPGESYTDDASLDLVAVWQKEAESTYTVTYDANGGIGAPAAQTKTRGVPLTLSSTVPTRSGYEFVGWTDNYTSSRYMPGDSYWADTSVTLYALWGKYYTLTYDANGGTGAPAAESTLISGYYIFGYVSSVVPTRPGYTFLGWSTRSTGSVEYQPGGRIAFFGDITLYAVWERNASSDAPKMEFIERLYNVCLGRNASSDEVAYYIWLLNDQGETGVSVAYKFIFADEFKAKNYCDKHYVIALYEAFMGREPSSSEIENWTWRLQQGDRREDVFNQFALSKEFGDICKKAGITQGSAVSVSGKGTKQGGYCTVSGCTSKNKIVEFATRLYTVCLNRQPGQSEVDAWYYNLVHGDYTATSASRYFIFSGEFTGKNYSDEEYTKHLYDAMMGRNGVYSADELAYWCWMLRDQGLTREQMFNQFAASDEFKKICQQYGVIHS